jgi:uncharacterized protein (UPF0276 family)
VPLPELGVGVVYWPELEPLLEAGAELPVVLEIEPQALWYELGGAEPYRIDRDALERVAAFRQAKLVHGVGFPVGGSRLPAASSLPPLVDVIQALEPAWASEHLGFNRASGPDGDFATGFVLPPRQTPEGIEAAARTIRAVAGRLPVPFAFEVGANYLRPRDDELADGSFFAAVAEEADCGILLDLHNVWLNERNGRQPVAELLGELPLERVWEVHVAGGFELDGYWLDAHSGAMPEPLVDLAADVVPLLPNLKALVFEVIPEHIPRFGLDAVAGQLAILARLWARRGGRAAVGDVSPPVFAPQRGGAPGPAEWEGALGALAAGRPASGPLAGELAADPGVAVIRRLVDEFRAGMVVDALRLTSRLILVTRGEETLRRLLADFWRTTPPAVFGSVEAQAFADFLEAQRPDVPYLPEVLAFERALIQARTTGEPASVVFDHDPAELLAAVEEGRLPTSPAAGRFAVAVTG